MAGDDSGAPWEELRREARKLEGDLDVKLSSYAKLCSVLSHNGYGEGSDGSSEGSVVAMEKAIEAQLQRLSDANERMSRCCSGGGGSEGTAATASLSQKVARHRDILQEFTQEFRRTRGNLAMMRQHAQLLSSSRPSASTAADLLVPSGSNSQSQLLERRAIHGNIAQMDDLISHAASTKAALASQRSLFSSIQSRVKLLSDRFPLLRNVLGAIRRKKSRDTLILGAVIAACTTFLIIYWLRK
ncbi:hypothetical protein CLOM_g4253 [Closterium sp. NIES-68]|nr:hypothetical protein CLOM_g4253 [Closterium sp. NIES-68]GJP69259.1 hypothetical protein CLOP_g203 [Closterium sp. NIES-67]